MKRKLTALFAVISAIILTLAACGSNEKEDNSDNIKQSKSKNELNLSSGDDIPTMDPSLASDQVSFTTFTQTLEGLYVLDKDDKPVPGVAKGEPEKSNDGKTWTIKLRDDAKWSNGDPVTAHDFVFAWRRTVDPDTAAEFSYMFENIENAKEITNSDKKPEELGVKAIDDQTLEIKLVKDVPWMESLLAFSSYMPQNEKFVKKHGDDFGTTAETTLSNGPFKLTEWKSEDKWKLEKNDKYWDKDKVKLKDVNIKVVKNTQTAINMYQTGKLDMVGLDAQNVKKYKDREDFSTQSTSGSYFFRINKEKNKDLENEDLRKAIATSVNKKSYVDSLLNNGSKPLDTLMIKDFVKDGKGKDYIDGVKSPLEFDKDDAKKSLEKAKKDLGKDKFTIELLTYDEDESKKAGEFVKEQVEKNLRDLLSELDEYEGEDHFTAGIYFHAVFENIHPFIDGNGRTGRMLINLQLLKAGYLPINIKQNESGKYYRCFRQYDKSKEKGVQELYNLITKYEYEELIKFKKLVLQDRK